MITHINIIDFDGSITAQSEFIALFKPRISISNLSRFQHAARLWTSPKKFAEICKTAFNGLKPGFTLIGSGDFHHYSLGLIKQYKTPLTIVLFDNHPDWMQPPHQYHCGTWVYSLARLPQVQRIIIIGLESGDINGKCFKNGDVESYLNQKIILLPYEPVIAEVIGSQTTSLYSLLKNDLQAGIAEIISHISTQHVYISIDKDCLSIEDAFTNWEQGSLPLSTVIDTIIAIKKKFEIVGADTVGDYSTPRFRSPLKWIGSLLDRKISRKPDISNRFKSELKRNELANISLFNALDG
ncbi:MAG: arginase family protein [Methylophilaceae bacterium]|nr:arginase family protein [Methylophilaceae bacterium]